MNKKAELVLPAGSLKKAEFAFLYGADACYAGLAKYSLRKAEVDFTISQIKKGIKLAHLLGRKFYVTFNVFSKNNQLLNLKKDMNEIAKFKPDAFIIADPGIFDIAKKSTKIPVHISTQANITNWQAAKFWQEQGAKRVVLARELTLREIEEIHNKVPKIELEVFVHGAMCISYSGRCLLSAAMTGREANQGDCAQPCRWKYRVLLEEEKRPGEYFEAKEDDEGTYIFNSKDLRLIEHLPKIIKSGVSGLKVEGRNKTEYYLSTIARAYKKAVNSYYKGSFSKEIRNLKKETEKVAHREYTTGFLFGKAKSGEVYKKRGPVEKYSFLGIISQSFSNNKAGLCPRNQIKKGEDVEILTPDMIYFDKVYRINNSEGEDINVVNPLPSHENVFLTLSRTYPKNSFLRKRLR